METIDILKLIADNNRMRILNLLYKKDKICVCVIEEILELNQSNLSRHLNKLKRAGIIIGEKRAQWVDYRISLEFIEEYTFLKEILEERMAYGVFLEDLKKIEITSC